jgi:predicted RND superfamily exporter protein
MEKFFRHPWIVIVVISLVTIFFAFQLPRAKIDNNNFRFLPDENEAKIVSDHIDDVFGPQVMIMVGLERPYGTVFEGAFLRRIREYTEEVEGVAFVRNINSIMSTTYITGEDDAIVAADMVSEDFSGTGEEIAELKRRIASWDLYQGAFVSDDLQATQIVVNLDATQSDAGSPEVIASLFKIRDRAKEMFAGFAEVYVTGIPVISATINEAVLADIVVLVPLVVLTVLLVLFFSFRRARFVVLSLLTVLVAAVWTVGAMPLFGVKFSMLSTLLPVIIVAVGSAYGIHVMTHYIEDTRNRILNAGEHRDLVFTLTRKLLKPVFLAALTTFAGFISFCFTSIVPMREFGVFASAGVMFSFLVAVTLIPALLLLRGPETTRKQGKAGRNKMSGGALDEAIGKGFLAVAQKRRFVLIAAILLVIVEIAGLSKLVVDNSVIDYFRGETDIGKSDRFIRDHFGGSRDITLVVEADSTEALLDPAVLCAVDNLGVYLAEHVPEVGKVAGFTDVIKRINQVFNVDESAAGIAPVRSAYTTGTDADAMSFGSFGDFGDFDFEDELPVQAAETGGGFEETRMEAFSVPDILALLDTAAGKRQNMSGNALVRELQRLANYQGYAYYEIPADPARYGKTTSAELYQLVSNYLVFIAGDDNMSYSNDPLEPTAMKTSILLRTTSNNDTRKIVNAIQNYVGATFPKTVRVTLGGGAITEDAVTRLIVGAQIISLAVSVLIVILIVAFSHRAASAGIIAAVPLIIAIMTNFAAMGFLGLTLNIATAIIASLSVGIGIDYTIHFIDFYKREYTADHSQGDDFLRRTFSGCGKAIMINAVSVGAGFAVIAFSRFKVMAEFGALVALSMAVTALVSLTVIPALLMTFRPKFIYGNDRAPR